MSEGQRLDAVAEAIWRIDSYGFQSAGPPHRRMAAAAIDALNLTQETTHLEGWEHPDWSRWASPWVQVEQRP